MDDEIEDFVGDIKYTDSQKSVATSHVYSFDFTDSGSERHNSSGKETYVIDLDESDDSELHYARSSINLLQAPSVATAMMTRDAHAQYEPINRVSRSSATRYLAQETFTQTSKTIIELAQSDRPTQCNNTLDTQTSFISITENKTVEYRIEVGNNNYPASKILPPDRSYYECVTISNNSQIDADAVEETTFKLLDLEEDTKTSHAELIESVNDEPNESTHEDDSAGLYEDTSEWARSEYELEEDSLGEDYKKKNLDEESDSEVPLSVDNDVQELYTKLTEAISTSSQPKCPDYDEQRIKCGTLTPLTEESMAKKDKLSIDIARSKNSSFKHLDDDILFKTKTDVNIKVLPSPKKNNSSNELKLPPIRNSSCPNSPDLTYLFPSHSSRPLIKSGTLPCLYEGEVDESSRWRNEARDNHDGAGESTMMSGRSDPAPNTNRLHLPPIFSEKNKTKNYEAKSDSVESQLSSKLKSFPSDTSAISVKDKIRNLKMKNKEERKWTIPSRQRSPITRSPSPGSEVSPDDSKLLDAAERGCEALCLELLKKLKSSEWYTIVDTLEEIPRLMDKFWSVITENRIADLLRQVMTHVESPRTQLARLSCTTLALILKNTNYTKKPDFYEAVTVLLSKTGCFSRPVRKAANMALDDIVCSVDLSHAVIAVCVHGVRHKSPLVRVAASRLLVVCAALGGGGRMLLRTRPPRAATARRHALRAMADLLNDKATDARKYAERLYSILRPLANFEAFYLTDVEVDVATRQMKKYDCMTKVDPTKHTR